MTDKKEVWIDIPIDKCPDLRIFNVEIRKQLLIPSSCYVCHLEFGDEFLRLHIKGPEKDAKAWSKKWSADGKMAELKRDV